MCFLLLRILETNKDADWLMERSLINRRQLVSLLQPMTREAQTVI